MYYIFIWEARFVNREQAQLINQLRKLMISTNIGSSKN
jgi:hypothetical protein